MFSVKAAYHLESTMSVLSLGWENFWNSIGLEFCHFNTSKHVKAETITAVSTHPSKASLELWHKTKRTLLELKLSGSLTAADGGKWERTEWRSKFSLIKRVALGREWRTASNILQWSTATRLVENITPEWDRDRRLTEGSTPNLTDCISNSPRVLSWHCLVSGPSQCGGSFLVKNAATVNEEVYVYGSSVMRCELLLTAWLHEGHTTACIDWLLAVDINPEMWNH